MFRLRVPASGFQCPASGLGFGVLVGKILRYRISPDPRQDTGLRVPDGKYSGSGEDICSLQHVYNSTYWLKPRSSTSGFQIYYQHPGSKFFLQVLKCGSRAASGLQKRPSDPHDTSGSQQRLWVPGQNFNQPLGSRTIVHPASWFQDDSPNSLWVPGRYSNQPPGSRTKVHPAYGFQDDSPTSLRVPGR
ncbi:hypothetical protein F2Q70_00043039 [Brassica cretica]|uniref:Uncharacterized protein n=1 Tax=Brassica cretica TaxID=69181 RepID=A0A8S9KAE3_BRACR|nr:hypothetical protein F2Q70_00043039 [Brassica cretica]